jgi:hypothetical protein
MAETGQSDLAANLEKLKSPLSDIKKPKVFISMLTINFNKFKVSSFINHFFFHLSL